MAATYQKLKSGDWGVRVAGDKPREGESITVKKRDGSVKAETIDKVVWSSPDGKLHLASVRQKSSASREVCAYCGKGGKLVEDLEDGLMKHYRCCDIPPGGC